MEFNKAIKEKRLKLNLSLEELSQKSSLSLRKIKGIEEGSIFPSKKVKALLIKALDITQDEYDESQDLLYSYIDNNDVGLLNRLSSFFRSKYTLFISLFLSIALIFGFSFSVRECVPGAYDSHSLYNQKLLETNQTIRESGKKTNDYFSLSKDFEGKSVTYFTNINSNKPGDSHIVYFFEKNNYNYKFTFTSDPFDHHLYVEVNNLSTDSFYKYDYYLNYLDTPIVYNNEESINGDFLESLELNEYIIEIYSDLSKIIDANIRHSFGVSLNQYLDFIKEGKYNEYSHESSFYYVSLLLFMLLVSALAIFITSLYKRYRSKKEITNDIKDIKVIPPKSPLIKDISFHIFVKENYFIIFTQIFFFVCQLSLYLTFANTFNINNISNFPYIETLIAVLRVMLPLANVLILFLNLNTKIIGQKALKTALTYIALGLVFASIESIVIYDLSRSGELFFELIFYFFPKNLFLAMGMYALLYYILFSQPNFLKGKKVLNILFRSFSLLIISFLLFSIIYTPLVEEGILNNNYYLKSLLASITLPYTFLALGYILIKKLVDHLLINKYGSINFEVYKTGNRYQYLNNLIFILLIFIIFILSLSFINNSETLDLLDLNNLVYLPCLFPLIFFYKNRSGKRNPYLDGASGLAYIISNTISYLLIFITMLSGNS